MRKKPETTSFSLLAAPLALAIAVVVCGSDARFQEPMIAPGTASSIVLGKDSKVVADVVTSTDGGVTDELGIIRGVAAELTPSQLTTLEENAGIDRISGNQPAALTKTGD